MQRVSQSLRRTCLRSEYAIARVSMYNAPNPAYRHSLYQCSRSFTSSSVECSNLPVLDFLHPPLVRNSIRTTRKQIKRNYSKFPRDTPRSNISLPNNVPEDIEFHPLDSSPSSEGWSASELDRQDRLSARRDDTNTLESIFSDRDKVLQGRRPERDWSVIEIGEEGAEYVPYSQSGVVGLVVDAVLQENVAPEVRTPDELDEERWA